MHKPSLRQLGLCRKRSSFLIRFPIVLFCAEAFSPYSKIMFDSIEPRLVILLFHAFGIAERKIDYVMCNRRQDCRVECCKVIKDGIYIFDHTPLISKM